jgi:class 3 adenylate cyclase
VNRPVAGAGTENMQDSNQNPPTGSPPDLEALKRQYEEEKRRYRELGEQIQRKYEREVTAVSVDVVQSRESKERGTPVDAQLTYDAYHQWVDKKLEQYGWKPDDLRDRRVWAGDGLMALWVNPDEAVAWARELLDTLTTFNARSNRLPRPVQIRIGIHTGKALPPGALALGNVASSTFDVAGHLQKWAAPNTVRISEATYELLKRGREQFAQVPEQNPQPGPAYAYPPTAAALAPAPPVAARVADGKTQAPAPASATAVPWLMAVGAVAVATAAIVWGILRAGAGPSPLPAPNPTQQPISLGPAPGGARSGDSGSPAGEPKLGVGPADPSAAGESPPTPPAVAAAGPSRELWVSPDANSGVPPHLVPSPPELRWMLSIGVGRYQNDGLSQEGAGSDARLAAELLQRTCGIPADHIQLLADEQATLANIRLAFQHLQARAASGKDTIYVYLAGHAGMANDRPDLPPHPSGMGYALAPFDADPANLPQTSVCGSDIAAWLGAARAQTVVLLVDTPSAGAVDVPSQPDPGRQFALIAAGGPTEKPGARSAQTSLFVEALQAALTGEADADRDRRVSLAELRQYLGASLPARSGGALNPQVVPGFGTFLPEIHFGG